MFEIPQGTDVLTIEDGKDWIYDHFTKTALKKSTIFEKEDMMVDPTGISRDCAVPSQQTLGGMYARAGYYAFRFTSNRARKFVILAKQESVNYLD